MLTQQILSNLAADDLKMKYDSQRIQSIKIDGPITSPQRRSYAQAAQVPTVIDLYRQNVPNFSVPIFKKFL